ncbi:sulfite exporter TauE/SafE family protein [Leptolyngbya sp. KIOST-1]|uniref:sulfite exporter TauE/SafE family protein n=1 Tax=Leptolyngbya sp. KIOST-1 TaxID=1229172 RepID=UPI00068F9501|nr:sulfite exporter TauE/SafE family protein [Leptolyngbya sp. KIOST-1]
MDDYDIALLALGGIFSGVLAGFLGIGGGVVLVPMLVAFGFAPVQSVATSSLAILVTSTAGSIQNWRMGFLSWRRVILLGLPAVITAQIGAFLAGKVLPYILLAAFGVLLLVNIYLVELRKRLVGSGVNPSKLMTPLMARLVTGGLAGFLAGLFGVGGGVIMVPLQILLLAEPIKTAIQTSLGVIVITAISACIGHGVAGNILVVPGLILGVGGLVGVQFSTRFLPKLPDQMVSLLFRSMLALLSLYIFVQAWQSYQGFGPLASEYSISIL